MRKWIALLLTACLLFSLAACGGGQTGEQTASDDGAATEQTGGRQTATEYQFALSDGEQKTVENLVFEQDVTVSGDKAQITFVNCEFQGNLINTADEGTQVVLEQSALDGQCIFQNSTKEATMAWSFPKFILDAPAKVVCEDCIGAVLPMGDFAVTFNGEEYTMADSELFVDLSADNADFVPYEGQQASYFCVVQWWENGEKVTMVECEYDPNM